MKRDDVGYSSTVLESSDSLFSPSTAALCAYVFPVLLSPFSVDFSFSPLYNCERFEKKLNSLFHSQTLFHYFFSSPFQTHHMAALQLL